MSTADSVIPGEETREGAFRLWINSLGLPGTAPIENLSDDLKTGITFLKIIEKLVPGRVDWSRVQKDPGPGPRRHHVCISNCSYLIDLCRDPKLGLSVVGIGGVDIAEGQQKFVLALLWQLMRSSSLKMVKEMNARKFGGDAKVDDQALIKWANDRVAKAGKNSRMKSFRGRLFILCLLVFLLA